jgi:molybdopterin/thiamine biosynthesis adenylyltransferase
MASRPFPGEAGVDLTAQEALDRTLLLVRQHRLPGAPSEDILAALHGTTVCIVADERNLSLSTTQSAVATLSSLVLQCGMRVRLVMPAAELVSYQPPLVGADLRSAIVELADDSVPGAEAEIGRASHSGDLVFVMGDTSWGGEAALAWRLTATSWMGQVAPPMETGERMAGNFPIGAVASAAAAAAEPFKAALRMVASGMASQVPNPEFLEPARRARIVLAPAGTSVGPFDLGPIDVVSAGAITTAAFHVLLRVPTLKATIRIFDPDVTDASNLNRYPLLRRSMVGLSKIQMLEHWHTADLRILGHQDRVTPELLAEVGSLAPRVLVGTDNVETRWLVQGTWPKWLAVAGTAGFMVMVSEHEPGQPCAGCLHPASESGLDNIPTISFVSYWAGLLTVVRLLRRHASGPASPDRQETEMWPDRLDERNGYRFRPIPAIARCPVKCPLSAGAA